MEILISGKRSLAGLLFDPPWNSLQTLLQNQAGEAATLLDVGCGNNSPIGQITHLDFTVGVDIHLPSIHESMRRGLHSSYVCMDVTNLSFTSKSFDIVVALDLIEHLEKPKAIQLLDKFEDIAAKRVIVFTPNGYVDTSSNHILARYDNNPWRVHRSGFTVPELRKRGYKCYGFNGLKMLRYGDAQMKLRPAKVFQVISNFTQLMTYSFPSLAFQFVGVKEMAGGQTNG